MYHQVGIKLKLTVNLFKAHTYQTISKRKINNIKTSESNKEIVKSKALSMESYNKSFI